MAVFAIACKSAFVFVVGLVAINAADASILEDRRFMTFFASHDCMQAGEREGCQPVIEYDFGPPGGCVVAVSTVFAEGGFVNILLFVAGEAFHRQFCGKVAMVAVLAFGFGMGAQEFKPGAFPMVKLLNFPACFLVADFAFFAKSAFVNVLDGVAIITRHR